MKEKKELTIIQMNDTHGYIDEHMEYIRQGHKEKFVKVGGYPRIKGYIDKVRREKNGNVLFLDGGDTFHGTYSVVQSKGENMLPLLNSFGLNGMTAHWEFAYGPEQFMKLTEKLNYPMLAINAYDADDNSLVFQPYTIEEVNGLKIGVIGIAATIIDKTMPKHFSKGMYFTDGKLELPKYIEELKEEKDVDLVVVLSHLGFPQEVEMAKQTDGIDVFLSAHTHNRIYEPVIVNDTIIIQSGCHGSFLGRLDLEIENKKIIHFDHKLVLLDESIEKDKKIEKEVKKILEPHRELLEEKVGETITDLARDRVLESTMDNLLLQSLMYHVKDADLAFSNGWRYGAPIPKGDITINDLWNIIPVNPPLSTVELTGNELYSMLEENLERTFSKDPFQQMGGYVKRSLGLNLYFKIENPKNHRIEELFVDGKPVDLDKTYKVVYVTSQGVPEKYGRNRKTLEIKGVDALARYVKDKGTVEAPLRGSVVAI